MQWAYWYQNKVNTYDIVSFNIQCVSYWVRLIKTRNIAYVSGGMWLGRKSGLAGNRKVASLIPGSS